MAGAQPTKDRSRKFSNRPLSYLLFVFIGAYCFACFKEYEANGAVGFATFGTLLAGAAIFLPNFGKIWPQTVPASTTLRRKRFVTTAVIMEFVIAAISGIWVGRDAVHTQYANVAQYSGLWAFITVASCAFMFSNLDEIDLKSLFSTSEKDSGNEPQHRH